MREYELVPGVKFEPLFKTDEEYQEFRRRFSEEMKPALDEQRRQRAKSELDSMSHWVD